MKTKFKSTSIVLMALLTLGGGTVMAASNEAGEMKKMEGTEKMETMTDDNMATMDGKKEEGMATMDNMKKDGMKNMEEMSDDGMQKMDGAMDKKDKVKKAMGS